MFILRVTPVTLNTLVTLVKLGTALTIDTLGTLGTLFTLATLNKTLCMPARYVSHAQYARHICYLVTLFMLLLR